MLVFAYITLVAAIYLLSENIEKRWLKYTLYVSMIFSLLKILSLHKVIVIPQLHSLVMVVIGLGISMNIIVWLDTENKKHPAIAVISVIILLINGMFLF